MARIANVNELAAYRKKAQKDRPKDMRVVSVCAGTGCKASGADKVVKAFHEEIGKQGLEGQVKLRATGCHGFCERGTLVVIHPEGILYQRVKPENVAEIVEQTVKQGKVLEQHLYSSPVTGEKFTYEKDIPFYKHQMRLILGKNGHIDPSSIDDYIAEDGYSALAKALEKGGDWVLDQVKRAKLRGRGGGGFDAGRKWESCRKAKSDKRYVICNADEGDPGAFMDRSVVEGNPHSVLEGMIIAAFCIGSDEGYIYVRHEYPLAVLRFGEALQAARELGLLGTNILGTGFNFDVKINRGGGAFVCGESTALMASIEGRVGEPRSKHIHTVVAGLYDKPTNLNNVETFANIPLIIDKGPDWYTSIGTKGSPGTKIFSLVGKVNNTGLVEAPMGMTLRQVIFDIGGGIPGGRKFKAVQTGGPSGGCLPESYFDLPVDFDELTKAGSMMGSGGMIVMDDRTCMVDVARYFLEFLLEESCGKCVPCREGVFQLHALLLKITTGKAEMANLEKIERLAKDVAKSALCGLGKSAPNPVLSTLLRFRHEYEQHIQERKCSAGVCRELTTFFINPEKCNGCMLCVKACAPGAISGLKKEAHVIAAEKCTRCGACRVVCKQDAVETR